MRVVSGKFEADREVYHVQGKKKLRLSRPQQLMAAEREIIEEAYAGDIIGVFEPRASSPSGTPLCAPGKKFQFDPHPHPSPPEHFERIRSVDTMKRKQFLKGVEQIAQEGAIQIFKTPYSGMEEVIVGRGGHPAVRRAGVPACAASTTWSCTRRASPTSTLRWIVKEDEDAPRPEGGGPAPAQRRQAGGGLQGQPACCCSPPSGPSSGCRTGTRTLEAGRVRRGQVLRRPAGAGSLPAIPRPYGPAPR